MYILRPVDAQVVGWANTSLECHEEGVVEGGTGVAICDFGGRGVDVGVCEGCNDEKQDQVLHRKPTY